MISVRCILIQTITKNEYSTEGQAAILQVSEDHYEKHFPGEQKLKGGDYDYANLEQFWEPADQESGLKEQLLCLNIQQIPIEELELRDKFLLRTIMELHDQFKFICVSTFWGLRGVASSCSHFLACYHWIKRFLYVMTTKHDLFNTSLSEDRAEFV